MGHLQDLCNRIFETFAGTENSPATTALYADPGGQCNIATQPDLGVGSTGTIDKLSADAISIRCQGDIMEGENSIVEPIIKEMIDGVIKRTPAKVRRMIRPGLRKATQWHHTAWKAWP